MSAGGASKPGSWRRAIVSHGLLLASVSALFLLIRAQGEQSTATAAQSPLRPETGAPPADTLLQVLLALALIVGVARLMGMILRSLGQPPVMGEIIGGIVLGPSIFGRLAPDLFAVVFPVSSAPFLNVIAQLGVILYMFLVGLDLDLELLRGKGPAMLAIAHASIALPFVLGSLLALGIHPRMAPPGVPFTGFALFLGVAMSVTAFPVLARILTNQGVNRTPLGSLVLGCAAIGDLVAWCLLALAVSTAQARAEGAIATAALTLMYVALMLVIARPVLRQLVVLLESRGWLSDGGMAILAVAVLVSALTTEAIGIHAIFGAFLLGAIAPRSRAGQELAERTQDIVRVLFLPTFFAYTGLRTHIGLLNTGEDWLLCGLIVGIATLGKWGGSTLAARLVGLRWSDASAVGILMNTRGLVELIVLNIGLDLKILSPTLFTMMVIMALVTTVATTPIFRAITHDAPWVDHIAEKGASEPT